MAGSSAAPDGLQGRTRLEKPLHKWLDGTDEAGRRLKYVLWGPHSTRVLEYDAEAQRWAVELSEGGRKLVRAPNLAVLSRDDCPPSLHDVVMLSRGAGKDPGVGGRGGGGLGAAHACDGGQQRPGGDTFAHAARGDTHTHTHTNTHQKKRVWIALFVFLS